MKLLMMTFVVFGLIQTTQAQTTLNKMSCDVNTITYYRLENGVTVKDVHPMDYSTIMNTESFENISYELDRFENFVIRNKVIKANDPQWYDTPSEIVYNQEGITFLHSDKDKDRFYPYNEVQLMNYQIDRNDAIENGVGGYRIFNIPDLGGQKNVIWSSNRNEVTVTDENATVIYNKKNLTIKTIWEKMDIDDEKITTTKYYESNREMGLNLLRLSVTEVEKDFMNGVHGVQVTVEHYGNYIVEERELRSTQINNMVHGNSIFPNPAKSIYDLNLKLRPKWMGKEVTVTIYNPSGQVVATTKKKITSLMNRLEFPTYMAYNGNYILEVNDGTESFTEVFVILN